MEEFLTHILPILLPKGCTFQIHNFGSKRSLLANLESRLQAYGRFLTPEQRIIILVDRDNDDCHALKEKLESTAERAGLRSRSRAKADDWQVTTRIVVEELEAWYFGDWEAVVGAYPRSSAAIPRRSKYRDPDAITGGTWEAFQREMKRSGYFKSGLLKVDAAGAVAVHMDPYRSTSSSFTVFRDAIAEATAF